jgi:hypothetical protein
MHPLELVLRVDALGGHQAQFGEFALQDEIGTGSFVIAQRLQAFDGRSALRRLARR